MASTFATAAQYSPLSGLITDNNYGAYSRGGGASTSGLGGAPGYFKVNPTDFSNPNAPSLGPAGANAPGTISGAGAYTPDWAGLINGDAGLIDAKNALDAGNVSDLAGRNAAIENAYVQFGSNIDFATLAKQLGMTEADVQQALGPDAQRLAQENTDAGLSTQARLGQANTNAINAIRANLNKRGLLNSGETSYELDQQNLGYRQAQTDSTQKLLGYLQQYQQGYLTAQQQRDQSLAGAYSSAADRQYNNNHGSPGVTATFAYTDGAGNHVYQGPDGSLYNLDGSAYRPPAPAAPAPPSQFTGDSWQSQLVHGGAVAA